MTKLRVCVIDDEPLALETVVELLRDDDDIEVVGTARSGRKAVDIIRRLKPDLIFLDIEMPGVDGFQALKMLNMSETPAVVFVTAHDKYALKAFETHAYDYILKPFDDNEFRNTVQRVKSRILSSLIREQSEGLRKMVEKLSLLSGNSYPEKSAEPRDQIKRITVRVGDRSELVLVSDILWVTASDHYCELHTVKGVRLIREPLKELEEALCPAGFIRIHRSSIVNIKAVKSFSPISHGDYQIEMCTGAKLRLSRSRSVEFKMSLDSLHPLD